MPVIVLGLAVEVGGYAVVLLMWELLEDFLLIGWVVGVVMVVFVDFGCLLVG